MARRLLAHAVDADMAGLDQRGSAGAGFHHPRMPQPFIETLTLQRHLTARTCHCASLQSLRPAASCSLQRRQFGERRIGIGGAVAFARCGAGGPRPMRRTAVALVAAPPLSRPKSRLPLSRPPPNLPLSLVLAVAALARPCPCPGSVRAADGRRVFRLSRELARRRALGRSSSGVGLDRRIGAGLAEILVALAASAAMPLAPGAVGGSFALAATGAAPSAAATFADDPDGAGRLRS